MLKRHSSVVGMLSSGVLSGQLRCLPGFLQSV